MKLTDLFSSWILPKLIKRRRKYPHGWYWLFENSPFFSTNPIPFRVDCVLQQSVILPGVISFSNNRCTASSFHLIHSNRGDSRRTVVASVEANKAIQYRHSGCASSSPWHRPAHRLHLSPSLTAAEWPSPQNIRAKGIQQETVLTPTPTLVYLESPKRAQQWFTAGFTWPQSPWNWIRDTY